MIDVTWSPWAEFALSPRLPASGVFCDVCESPCAHHYFHHDETGATRCPECYT